MEYKCIKPIYGYQEYLSCLSTEPFFALKLGGSKLILALKRWSAFFLSASINNQDVQTKDEKIGLNGLDRAIKEINTEIKRSGG